MIANNDACSGTSASRRRRLPTWVYLLATVLLWSAGGAVIYAKSPGLVQERLRPGPGAKESLFITLIFVLPAWIGHYAVAWLDTGRYHWSDNVPFRLQVAALIGFIASNGIIFWAEFVNPFFSSVVRIQRERGHYVVTSGPYQFVRHPGYIASILGLLFSGLALGSWLAALVGTIWVPYIIRRTVMEDEMLHQELEGYREYAKKVRYRLIPGVW